MRGRDVLLEVLRTEGVRHIFGNPGTTELPFIDALADNDSDGPADLHYVLALQEATAVGMADGYAQATRRPAFLNLHTSAGLGNAIGNLTNAQANRTPLVVTAGQQDRRHLVADPLLSGDLVGLARGVSKWTHEVRNANELGTILRRAFHDAASAPSGPVFVSIPMDVLDDDAADGTVPAVPAVSSIRRRAVADGVDELAAMLGGSIAIVAGDEVAASGAVDALADVARRAGAAVFGAPLRGAVVYPRDDPQWRGDLPPLAAAINAALAPFDRVLVIGERLLVYPYSDGPLMPASVDVLHLTADAGQLGRVQSTVLGLLGDVRATLEAVADRLPTVDAAAAPTASSDFDERARSRYGDVPMHPMAATHALLRALPADAPVVDEAITTGAYVRGFHGDGQYFFNRGGGLGWGMPAALGISLALDRGPVVCVVGDGSAMYSPQALWTAAHEQLPVLFAVVNNRQYLILKRNLPPGKAYPGLDLDAPPVDFVALAESMGVGATLVEKADDVADAARAAWDSGEPRLLELPISAP
ncbi:MAG TPA: thiamine pyrophosphate-binding protein [Acidimicrobiales bacterium]|nr:thiamine pyrophosphate-binding protein [Acidimicrobiales bacterium]